MQPNFDEMSLPERIRYVQDLWDRIADDAEAQPLSRSQAAELDRRLASYRATPEASIPWEVARQRLRRS